ncbi:MAG: hypothetical protein ABJB55_08680 [Actinomycetota bacterium]
MRRKLMIASTLAVVLLVACGGGGDQELQSLGPPPEASPTGNASPTAATGTTGTTINGSGGPVPTTSPGITGSVTTGNAIMAISGALQTTQPTLPLSSPAVYAPPPGAFALNWASAAAGFALGGTSFVGTHPTSADLRLTLFVHSASGTTSYSSTDGGCQVTVTQAEASAFSGTFSCSGIADVNGAHVVDAQGSFAAAG